MRGYRYLFGLAEILKIGTGKPRNHVGRIEPLQIVNPEAPESEKFLLEAMTRAWEKDWSEL